MKQVLLKELLKFDFFKSFFGLVKYILNNNKLNNCSHPTNEYCYVVILYSDIERITYAQQ